MALKVLHIFHSINHSGAEMMYASSAHLFIEEGVELNALSTGDEIGTYVEIFKREGFTIFHMPLQRKWGIKYYLSILPYYISFYRFLVRERFDVMHIHRNHLFWLYALVGKFAGIKIILRTVHSVFRPRFYRWPSYFLARHFSKRILKVKITSIGQSVYENELNHFRNKTIVINNWYNDQVYKKWNLSSNTSLIQELGYNQDSFVLISVGSCLPQKRHNDIITALSILNLEIDNLYYLHIGTGALEEEEKKYARLLGVENIKFIGNVDNVVDYFKVASVFIMPSELEGLGLSAVEAMAMELPVIFYNSVGLKDLLDEKGTRGLLISKSVESLAEAVKIIYNDQKAASEMGKKAAKFVEKNYSMHKSVLKFIKLYRGEESI